MKYVKEAYKNYSTYTGLIFFATLAFNRAKMIGNNELLVVFITTLVLNRMYRSISDEKVKKIMFIGTIIAAILFSAVEMVYHIFLS